MKMKLLPAHILSRITTRAARLRLTATTELTREEAERQAIAQIAKELKLPSPARLPKATPNTPGWVRSIAAKVTARLLEDYVPPYSPDHSLPQSGSARRVTPTHPRARRAAPKATTAETPAPEPTVSMPLVYTAGMHAVTNINDEFTDARWSDQSTENWRADQRKRWRDSNVQ
jgi:hypothetical protein